MDGWHARSVRQARSAEKQVQKKDQANSDSSSDHPVHVLAAAHLHLDVLGALLHADGGVDERLAFVAGLLEELAALDGQLEVLHDYGLRLFQLLAELAHLGPVVRVVVPLRHESVHLVLELLEGSLGRRSLEGQVELRGG